MQAGQLRVPAARSILLDVSGFQLSLEVTFTSGKWRVVGAPAQMKLRGTLCWTYTHNALVTVPSQPVG